MTVIYVDSVFVLNAVMDYLLLLCTARLAGVPLRRGRYLLGALAGGAYAVAVFLPGLEALSAAPVKGAVGVLLAVVAFGGEEKLMRLTLLLLAVSCGLAGCVLGLGLLAGGGVPMVNGILYTDVNAKTLLLASTAAYLVLTLVFHAAAKHGLTGELTEVRVCLGGRVVQLTALLDTGSSLRDPVSGEAVLVVARGGLDAVLPVPVRRLLGENGLYLPADLLEPLRQAAPELRFYLLPYRSVGQASGLLLAVRSEWTEIEGERHPGMPVALAPGTLGAGYHALWGGQVRRRGHHETVSCVGAAAAGKAGAAGSGQHPLHWRQRHPAAAADQGAGGRAAGPAGPGAGAAGADRA